jgi:hypothetical protein
MIRISNGAPSMEKCEHFDEKMRVETEYKWLMNRCVVLESYPY